MPSCCDATDAHFGEKHARRDIARYRRKGADPTTQDLIDRIRSLGLNGKSLLDVGAGIGAIHHALVPDVFSTVTHVDLSSAYLGTARVETERLNHSDRVRFVYGDLVSIPDLPESDVVTLDRVVCCYPDYESLLVRATEKSRRAIALCYPRSRWYVRLVMWLDNLKRVLKGDPFRAFVHPIEAVEALIERRGFRLQSEGGTLLWKTVLFERA